MGLSHENDGLWPTPSSFSSEPLRPRERKASGPVCTICVLRAIGSGVSEVRVSEPQRGEAHLVSVESEGLMIVRIILKSKYPGRRKVRASLEMDRNGLLRRQWSMMDIHAVVCRARRRYPGREGPSPSPGHRMGFGSMESVFRSRTPGPGNISGPHHPSSQHTRLVWAFLGTQHHSNKHYS